MAKIVTNAHPATSPAAGTSDTPPYTALRIAVAAASPANTAPTVINQRPRSIPSSRRITNTATKMMTIPVSSSSMAGPSLTYPGQWHCVGRSTAANRSQLMLPLPAAAVQCGTRTRCPSRADESATASLDDPSGVIVTSGYQASQ